MYSVLKPVLIIAAGLLSAGLAAGPPAPSAKDSPPERVWPLPIQPGISSNFCEYREGHFHAGLDLRTYGEEGVPCRVSSDGYVSRIRASAFGYGKAVYIQLETGETLVYAHLSEFSPELEEAVLTAQIEAGCYDVDFRFKPGRFPVKKGDVIAYTGSTGATAPHLHFEIRDRGENPLNPFSHGFSLEDKIPPRITRVDFLPLDADARIDGSCFPVQLTAARTGPGSYIIRDTLVLEGEVGISAEIIDRLNAVSGKLAPFYAGLSVDGENKNELTLERFSFGHTGQVDFLYDITRVRLEKEYFIQLFQREGETLWNRFFTGGGRLNSPGVGAGGGKVHEAVVTAADRAGNRSELTFYFRGAPERAVKSHQRKLVRARPPAEIPGFYFFDGFAARNTGYGQASRGDSGDSGGFSVFRADQLAGAPVVVPYRAGAAKNYVHLFGVMRGRPRSVLIPALDVKIVFGARSLYADMVAYAAGWEYDDSSLDSGELVPASRMVRIGPYSATLKADVEISFVVPRPDSTHAIYRLNERKMQWIYYESSRDDGVVSTTAKQPGVYAVFSDTTAPGIGDLHLDTHTSYATGRRTPRIVIGLDDAGSGLDAGETGVYVAGVKQISRWDDNQKKMFILVRDPNIIGRQALTIAACDKIGNRSRLETTINLRHQ